MIDDSTQTQVRTVFECSRLFTADDVLQFCCATRDRNLLHHDEEFARCTKFGGLIVPGLLVASLFTNAFAGWDAPARRISLEFRKPVFIGERVHATIQIIERNGVWSEATFECRTAENRLVLKGTLVAVSEQTVPGDPLNRRNSGRQSVVRSIA